MKTLKFYYFLALFFTISLNIAYAEDAINEDKNPFPDPCELESVQCEGETVTKQIVDWEAFQFHLNDLFTGTTKQYVTVLAQNYQKNLKGDAAYEIKGIEGKIIETIRGSIVIFPNLKFIYITQENFSLRNIIKDIYVSGEALYGLMILNKKKFSDQELQEIETLKPQVFESNFLCDLKSDNEGVPACDRKDGLILLINGKMYLQKNDFHVEGTIYYYPKETVIEKSKNRGSHKKTTALK